MASAKKKSQVRSSVQELVDKIGDLKSTISDLTAEEKALSNEIKSFGDGEYDGVLFRGVVATYEQDNIPKEWLMEKQLFPQV